MSKKKAFSGSTMTLKDFHGGSIPSDLPLPSAPGVVVRPSDRSQIQSPWGNPNNRFDYRSRPGSSGANSSRNFDDKAGFLTHPVHIGRNFDEDERKPLDGVSLPRRTVSDESIRLEPKTDSLSVGKVAGRPVHSPIGNPVRSSGSANPVVAASTPASQTGSVPNAWGVKKEAMAVREPVPPPSSTWSGPNAVSRFQQASALEKVSSGRWQFNKPLIHNSQPNVDVLQFPETDGDKDNSLYSGVSFVNEKSDLDVRRGRYVERNQGVEEEIIGGRKEVMYQERARSPMLLEGKDRNLLFSYDVVRPASTEGDFVGSSQVQSPVPAEVLERPKLKLLPRSKPLESTEPQIVDYKQEACQQFADSVHIETVGELHRNGNSLKPKSAGSEGGNQAVERPRLNLKPRSQPSEQSEEIAERERKSLFGGARPRELVLKERGVDDVAITNPDLVQSPNRTKHDHPKTETKPEVVQTPRYGDRAENFVSDQRTGRDTDRRDHRADPERVEQRVHRADNEKPEMRGSWRNENWRNNNSRGTEKQQQQERRPEPDTWRKPIEQPKPAPLDVPGLQGKATSALELAQAFSRSKSDAKTPDRVSGQRGSPGRNQIPFSRLTDTREFYTGPTPRHHKINGY